MKKFNHEQTRAPRTAKLTARAEGRYTERTRKKRNHKGAEGARRTTGKARGSALRENKRHGGRPGMEQTLQGVRRNFFPWCAFLVFIFICIFKFCQKKQGIKRDILTAY
jgi:hypothetical protein